MKLCPVCWSNGRSLQKGSCLCTGDVLTSSAFYEWMGSLLEPLPARKEEAPKPVYVQSKAKLVFGDMITKSKRRTSSATPPKPE